MATRQEFCDKMYAIYATHGVYIGTANGEMTEGLRIGQIKDMELKYGRSNPMQDVRRDLEYIGSCYEKGWDMSKSRAGDCSGIVVGAMRELGIIEPFSDFRARDFQKKAAPVQLKDLIPGDLVFDKTSEATHMGVYDYDGMVIESQGRDKGVVRRKLSAGHWVIGGRLDWFSGAPEYKRELYYDPDNLMRGEDVRECQLQLNKRGFPCGAADGIFGINTRNAVANFQKDIGLNVKRPGTIGKKTWAKLWEV